MPFSVTPNTPTTFIRIGPDKNRLLRSQPFQRRILPKNLRAVQLLLGHTKLESTVTDLASKSMMLRKSPGTPILAEARTRVRAVLVRMEQNDHTTGACKTGVKVRITRQRMVGRIARHSSADIAAGVTTSHPWPFAPSSLQTD
jgi:hypothetical protein